MAKSLEESKADVLAELKESTGLSDTDFEKFVKSTDTLIERVVSVRKEANNYRIELKEFQEKFNEAQTKWESEKKALSEAKEQELLALKKQVEDKEKEYEPVKEKAAKYEKYDAEKRNAIKEALKDKWLPSFEVMPLFDLEKIFNNLMPDNKLIETDNGKGKKASEKEYFTMDEIKSFTTNELKRDDKLFEKVTKSLEYHNKNKKG